jgi:hypothetical protein
MEIFSGKVSYLDSFQDLLESFLQRVFQSRNGSPISV